MEKFFIQQLPDGAVGWICHRKKPGLVEGGEAFYVTAFKWGGVLDVSLTEVWTSRGWGSLLFNSLHMERRAGLVLERSLDR